MTILTCHKLQLYFVYHIRSCIIGNLRVNVGDFVLINNADDPDRTESAYIAKLLDMFDNGMSFKPVNDCHVLCLLTGIFLLLETLRLTKLIFYVLLAHTMLAPVTGIVAVDQLIKNLTYR